MQDLGMWSILEVKNNMLVIMKNEFVMMKTRTFLPYVSAMLVLATMTVSCSKTEIDDHERKAELPIGGEGYAAFSTLDGGGSGGVGPGNGTGGNTQAGVVTAGEWNDLKNWPFWAGLMQSEEFSDKSDYWSFYTNHRIALRVTDKKGQEIAGAAVKLLRKTEGGEITLWETVTDNHGLAECWVGLFQKETVDENTLSVSINGQVMEKQPVVWTWDVQQQLSVNNYVITPKSAVKQSADIAFVVDATGSMHDEIDFLKNDLVDIIGKASSVRPNITMRTSALFYRDEGDEYLTRHSDFTEDLSSTAGFINLQNADGGGDYPEAVHTALEKMLQKLSWDETARTRLAFLVLDAPAHYQQDVISSLQQSIRTCAQMGIRLIPVAASGVDKNTEFMLRFFAIATGGTYVFITDDSGVGESHLKASVGDYQVEQLNELIIRLIEYYTE